MKAVILEGSAVNPGDITWESVEKICETDIFDHTTEENKWDRLDGYEAVLTNKVIIDEEVFSRFPGIRYVGVCATGYNVVDLPAARRHGVTVTNVPAYSTESVVQFTWALILDLASKITLHAESVRQGDWVRAQDFCYWKQPVEELTGKTLGIYGFGNIGRNVARIAGTFGMNVLVHTKNPSKYLSYIDQHLRFCDSGSLYAYSDILTFHCPLDETTKEIVNAQNIARMKDGVVLINVARGGLVNEKDLADALRSGKIAAAGIDVIAEEPMRKDSPLLDAPNILITPHIAWAGKRSREKLVRTIAENLEGFITGNPQNVVS